MTFVSDNNNNDAEIVFIGRLSASNIRSISHHYQACDVFHLFHSGLLLLLLLLLLVSNPHPHP